jgi:hypothetical protein
MKQIILTYFFIIAFFPYLLCQKDNQVKIDGVIYNKESQQPLGYVQLVSYKSLLSYASGKDGSFLIYLDKSDSIKIVSMGFEAVTMKATDFLKTEGPDTIYLEPATYLLNEVTINAYERTINLNLPGDIGKNVDPDAEPDRSLPKPSLGMIFSPLSLAQSTFSREAKNHRKLRKNVKQQNERALWNEVISSGLLEDWIEIEDDEREKFIIYCNQNIKVTKADNLASIQSKILLLWDKYSAEKK